MRIENLTKWRTDHLRTFVREVAKRDRSIPKGHIKRLRIKFRNYKYGCCGRAAINGYWMSVSLPQAGVDKADLALVIAHELGHTYGYTHKDMRGDSWFRRIGDWRERFAWAHDLPLEPQPAKAGPSAADRIDQAHRHAVIKLAEWQSKIKRAQTAAKKWQRRIKSYEKRAAAYRAEIKTESG